MNKISENDRIAIINSLKVGDYVYIKSDIERTVKVFGAGPDMHMMAEGNKKYRVEDVGPDWVFINHYTWAIDDIALPEDYWGKKPERKVVKFNTKEILT